MFSSICTDTAVKERNIGSFFRIGALPYPARKKAENGAAYKSLCTTAPSVFRATRRGSFLTLFQHPEDHDYNKQDTHTADKDVHGADRHVDLVVHPLLERLV